LGWEPVSGKRRVIVFPIAFPNIITGLILSIGRVSGETAPILFTVAAYFYPKLPTSIFDQAMALPYHLYDFDQRY
jgi:phosphate transport system permease protein